MYFRARPLTQNDFFIEKKILNFNIRVQIKIYFSLIFISMETGESNGMCTRHIAEKQNWRTIYPGVFSIYIQFFYVHIFTLSFFVFNGTLN